MDAFDMTLFDFILLENSGDDGPGSNQNSMRTLAAGLVALLNHARSAGMVHCDLHSDNLGIKYEGVSKLESRNSPPKQKASVKFCDYSRSFTLSLAQKAKDVLQRDLQISPKVSCSIGNLGDIMSLCSDLLSWVSRLTDVRRTYLIKLVYVVLKGTCFAQISKKIHEENKNSMNAELYEALYHANIVVTEQTSNITIFSRNLDMFAKISTTSPDEITMATDLINKCNLISKSIYARDSPARPPEFLPLNIVRDQEEQQLGGRTTPSHSPGGRATPSRRSSRANSSPDGRATQSSHPRHGHVPDRGLTLSDRI
jgi:hypothetical protein